MNFLLFNGPPRSGKDTAALAAWDYLTETPRWNKYSPVWEKFSFPNKRAFAGQMNGFIDNWGNVEDYEDKKGEDIPILGVSYRQWQIDYSEKFMKPMYGEDIFGRLLLKRCLDFTTKPNTPIFIVSDCGFQVEVEALRGHNVCLFSMLRHGTSFEGDSRQWVEPLTDWYHYEIKNDYSLGDLATEIRTKTQMWLDGTGI